MILADNIGELFLPSAIICLANGVRTKVAVSVAVASTPLPATVRIAIVVSRITATVRAKTRLRSKIFITSKVNINSLKFN